MSEHMKCPKCQTPLDIKSDIMKDSRFSVSLTPIEGALMHAGTVGGMITNIRKMIRATGRDVGAKVDVMVEKMETDENGVMTIHLLTMAEARHE